MRKLVVLLAIALVVSFQSNAQEKREKVNKRAKLSSEQMATLQSKKMTLALDLNANQQKEIFKLMKSQADDRKNKMAKRKQLKESGAELSADDKFKMESERLDKQIVHKAAMKKILNEAQFEKWSKHSKARSHQGREKMMKAKKMKQHKKGQELRKKKQLQQKRKVEQKN